MLKVTVQHSKKHKLIFFISKKGVGFLTEELVKAGAPRVATLESDKALLPFTEELAKCHSDRLQCVYGDVTRLDPIGEGAVLLPAMTSADLFQILGVKSSPWESGKFPIQFIACKQFKVALHF